MDVILLKKVGHLGSLGDKVSVRPGYGRNYLIPQGFAVSATEANLKAFEERRAELEHAAMEGLHAAEARRDQLDGLRVTIARKAGDEGRLFGSVGPSDIAAALSDAGYPVDKREVRMPHGPLRNTGEHELTIHVHADVDAAIKVEIVPDA